VAHLFRFVVEGTDIGPELLELTALTEALDMPVGFVNSTFLPKME
jgi:hypothetical protein